MRPLKLDVLSLVFALAALCAAPVAVAQDVLAARAGSYPDTFERSATGLYAEGLSLSSTGDDRGAFEAFLAAAERGHARAQRRVAEIYDRGNIAVQRDYAESIRWYQKAREQGEQIAMPPRRSFGIMGYGS